jgi:hypothetical protein
MSPRTNGVLTRRWRADTWRTWPFANIRMFSAVHSPPRLTLHGGPSTHDYFLTDMSAHHLSSLPLKGVTHSRNINILFPGVYDREEEWNLLRASSSGEL